MNSNWNALKDRVSKEALAKKKALLSRKRADPKNASQKSNPSDQESENILSLFSDPAVNAAIKESKLMNRIRSQVLAIDCEMVGVGEGGSQDVLARVSIVDIDGNIMLDEFIKPKERVTDFRTWVSGVRASNLKDGKSIEVVRKMIADIIAPNCILVGHALENDLKILLLDHPRHLTRDTSRYHEFRKFAMGRTPSLKKLSLSVLGLSLQQAEHSSVDDARASMLLYRLHCVKWETSIRAFRLAKK